MGEHSWLGIEYLLQQSRFTGEVRDEYLDSSARVECLDLGDGLGVQPCALVGQVIARHPGDRGVAKVHCPDRLSDPSWLIYVEGRRLSGIDLAEIAAACALLAADEEGGLAVLPALVDVWAARLLTDGMEALAFHEFADLEVLGPGFEPGADPLGLALDRGLGIAGLDAKEAAALVVRACEHGVGHAA